MKAVLRTAQRGTAGTIGAMPSDPELPANVDRVLSVTSLNRMVRDCLESAFPLTWVGGEISNLTFAASGHVYFSLKDASAQVRCVMWRSRAQLLGWRPENGQRVEARALVSFYEPRGEFQLNIEALRRAGQGDLFERFLKLKAKLETEGLFDPAGKRALPGHPRALAIVTSLQAAALRDVLTTLRRRAPHLRIDLYPTPVQGDGAAERIAAALDAAAAGDCDAIILCRGGGSIEDLWAFNEEIVARAIRASRLPVVSGIGHETDFTIADFAADLRAPTPTAAAELLSPDRDALLAALGELQRRLSRLAGRTLADRAQQLDWLGARLIHPAERIRARREALDQFGQRLTRAESIRRATLTLGLDNLGRRLGAARPRPGIASEPLRHLQSRLDTALRQKFFHSTAKLEQLAGGLSQLDPRAVLRRGYALAVGPDGRAVRDAARLTPGDGLRLEFARGEAAVTVTQVVATRKGQ
jgi:exodeoxyribonuclease VII large subunit